MAIETGKLIRVTWDGDNIGAGPTLEVEHADGSMSYLVVVIDRMTDRIPPAGKPKRKRKQGGPR
jgi:hypothetical protein